MVPNATKLCYKSVFFIFSSIWASFCWKLYIILVSGMRISQNLDLFFLVFFFWADSFLIFSRFFCFPFSLPFFSLYLLPFITFLSTGRVLASVLLKTWKWNIDQLGDLGLFYHQLLQPKLDTFFWYSSARIWSIFKMDTRMDGSVLAVLAAYQNNLVTSKMMTSQVAEWFPTSTSGKYNSWRKRVIN